MESSDGLYRVRILDLEIETGSSDCLCKVRIVFENRNGKFWLIVQGQDCIWKSKTGSSDGLYKIEKEIV